MRATRAVPVRAMRNSARRATGRRPGKRLALTTLLGAASWLMVSCHDGDSATGMTDEPGPVALAVTEIASGFDQPVQITHGGDGSGRLFVVERHGVIAVLNDGVRQATPFLDISGRVGSTGSEQGLLGLAFPPDYAAKGHFYVDYNDLSGDTVVARFHLAGAGAGAQADPASEETLLRVDQPFANHNGGQLAFGPDGFLYIGLGDGGSGGDPGATARR